MAEYKETTMPNWCQNNLTVDVPEGADPTPLIEAVGGEGKFSLNAFLPIPEPLLDRFTTSDGEVITIQRDHPEAAAQRERNRAEYGASFWYDWCVQNWGTKWDVSDTQAFRSGDRPVYEFDTAWAAPSKAIAHLSKLFPDYIFALAFDEPDMDFGGYFIFRGGEVVDSVDGGSRQRTWAEESEWRLDDVR